MPGWLCLCFHSSTKKALPSLFIKLTLSHHSASSLGNTISESWSGGSFSVYSQHKSHPEGLALPICLQLINNLIRMSHHVGLPKVRREGGMQCMFTDAMQCFHDCESG